MTFQLNVQLREAFLNSYRNILLTSSVRIYAGSVPADNETAITTQALVFQFPLEAQYVTTPTTVGGRVLIQILGVPADEPARASGTPTFARIIDSSGDSISQGEVGAGKDLQISISPTSTQVVAGSTGTLVKWDIDL